MVPERSDAQPFQQKCSFQPFLKTGNLMKHWIEKLSLNVYVLVFAYCLTNRNTQGVDDSRFLVVCFDNEWL